LFEFVKPNPTPKVTLSGIWHLVSGIWYLVYSIRHQHQASGIQISRIEQESKSGFYDYFARMKIVAISILTILFINLSLNTTAQKGRPVMFRESKIKVPFDMPAIKVPDFRKCSTLSIVEFGAESGDKEKT